MDRAKALAKIRFAFKVNPIVAILGPRQVGKTTVAKMYLKELGDIPAQNYFDLENARDVERLSDPLLTLPRLSGLIVIDEIQYLPELFPTLRVLVDDPTLNQQYLILGSASGELMHESSETLAGRISYIELTAFSVPETGDMDPLWIRGGFPKAYLAQDHHISMAWRQAFIKTFLEKDIPKLGIRIPPENLRRFWLMLAHYQGCIFNAAEIGGSLNLTSKTIKRYADILCQTFMIRLLKPWHANIKKRQIKSPKLYIRDSGIFHALADIHTMDDLLLHPKLGASWESFALEEIIKHHEAEPQDCYFWSTAHRAELDLIITQGPRRIGFEIKHSSAPKLSRSIQIAEQDLQLDAFYVIYPGSVNYQLTENIEVIGLHDYLTKEPVKPV